jgi:hypothetical protein
LGEGVQVRPDPGFPKKTFEGEQQVARQRGSQSVLSGTPSARPGSMWGAWNEMPNGFPVARASRGAAEDRAQATSSWLPESLVLSCLGTGWRRIGGAGDLLGHL